MQRYMQHSSSPRLPLPQAVRLMTRPMRLLTRRTTVARPQTPRTRLTLRAPPMQPVLHVLIPHAPHPPLPRLQ